MSRLLSKCLIRYIALYLTGACVYLNCRGVLAADPIDSLSRIEQEFANKKLSKDSLAALVEIVDKYPTNSHAHIVLGNCCDSFGLPEQAMEQYKLAFKYGPNEVESFLELVKALVRTGQLTAASSLLMQAMQRFPADPQVLFWTGNALYKEQRYDEAKALYQEAWAKSHKPIVGLYSALGSLDLREGRYGNALRLAMADLSHDKNLPQANEVAGLALERMSRYEKALPYLTIAFKYNPENYSLAYSFARSLMWCAKYNQAFMPALFALSNAPHYEGRSLVINTMKTITPHLSKGEVQADISQASQSRYLWQNPLVHQELMRICIDKGLLDLALVEGSIAVRLNPQSANARYKLALMLENYKHDYPAALQYLREAQVLDPYDHDIKQCLMRLEDRLTINKADWAWQLKDWLNKCFGLRLRT